MSFHHGRKQELFYGGYQLSPYMREASFQRSIDTPETTAFGSTSKSYLTGIPDARISGQGMYHTTSQDAWMWGGLGGDDEVLAIYAPRPIAAGSDVRCVMVHNTNYQVQASVADVVSFSLDLQGSQVASRALCVAAPASRNSSGNSPSLDNGAATALGAECFLQVRLNVGTTLDVVMQHSPDNSTWGTLATFPTVSSGTQITTAWVSVAAAATTPDRYVRTSWTITGGTAVSFSTYIHRY